MLIHVDSELVKPKEQPLLATSLKVKSATVYDASQKSIWEMATSAESAAANSGKIVQQVNKQKELRMSKEALMDHISELIKTQEGRCALTGIPLQYRGEHEDELLLASLDRKDSNAHYEKPKSAGRMQICQFLEG